MSQSEVQVRWVIREGRELGKEGRMWELTKGGLSVGRSGDRDIQVLSQTVEEKHATFSWHPKKEAYIIQDLGSVNGTYVNSRRPLRKNFTVLEPGDAIRFGYEKSHVFRVETVTHHPTPPTATPTTSSSSSTTTSSNVVSTQTSPAMADPPPVAPAPPSTTQHQGVNVQYVPVSSQPPTIIIPAVQSAMPFVMQPVPYGYATPLHIQQTPNMVFQPVSSTQHLYQQPAMPTMLPQYPATPPSSSEHLSVEDIESESVFNSHTEESLKPRKDGRRAVSLSDAPNLSKGTRLYGQPNWWGEGEGDWSSELSVGSPGHGSKILRDIDPGGERIKVTQSHETFSPSLSRDSPTSEELRKMKSRQEKGIPTSWVVDLPTPSSAGRKPRPARLDRFRERRPRSADPSPTRVKGTITPVQRCASPGVTASSKYSPVPPRPATTATMGGKKGSTPGGTSRSAHKRALVKKPPSGARPDRSTEDGVATPTSRSKQMSTAASKNQRRREPREEPGESTQRRGFGEKPVPTAGGSQNLTYTVPEKMDESLSRSEGSPVMGVAYALSAGSTQTPTPPAPKPHLSLLTPLKSASDIQVSSEPRLHRDTAFAVREADQERPGSARKQWNNNQPQAPENLMLASIEARMRRLNKMAQATAQNVGSLKPVPAIQWGHGRGLTCDAEAPPAEPLTDTPPPSATVLSSPAPPPPPDLPEWKFFDKDVDSIFRNIRSVEKWLREIDSTVVSLQLLQGAGGWEGEMIRKVTGEEEVDYPVGVEEEEDEEEGEEEEEDEEEFQSAESDCEMFPDSMEDVGGSPSTNEGTPTCI